MAYWTLQTLASRRAAPREKASPPLGRSQQRLRAIADGGFGDSRIHEIGLSFGGQFQTTRRQHVDAAHDAACRFRYQQQTVIGKDLATATGRRHAVADILLDLIGIQRRNVNADGNPAGQRLKHIALEGSRAVREDRPE